METKRDRFVNMEGHVEVPSDETATVAELERNWKEQYMKTKDGRLQVFVVRKIIIAVIHTQIRLIMLERPQCKMCLFMVLKWMRIGRIEPFSYMEEKKKSKSCSGNH